MLPGGARRSAIAPFEDALDWLPKNARSSRSPARRHGGVRAVLEDRWQTRWAIDALVTEAGGPAWDEAGFRRLRDHVAGELGPHDRGRRADRGDPRCRADVRRRLEPLDRGSGRPGAPGRRGPGRPADRPGLRDRRRRGRLPDIERYLHAAARRLERLPDNPARDLDRMRGVNDLEALHRRTVDEGPPAARCPPACARSPGARGLPGSHFAQGLGTRGQVSAKRIRRVIEEAATAPR